MGKKPREVLGFSLAGIGALLIDSLLFNFLYFSGFNSSLSSLVAVATALVFNFIINFFSFSEDENFQSIRPKFFRFLLVAIAFALYTHILFETFTYFFPHSSQALMAVVRALIFLTSSLARFLLYRRWVFGKK